MAVGRMEGRAAKAKNGGRRYSRCPEGAEGEGGGVAPRAGSGIAGPSPSSPSRVLAPAAESFSEIVLASPSEFPYSSSSHGGVAQLGERLTGSQEVRGSIPLVSTRALNEAPTQVGAFFSYLSLFAMCWPGSILATYPLLIADMNVNNFTSLDGKASLQRQ